MPVTIENTMTINLPNIQSGDGLSRVLEPFVHLSNWLRAPILYLNQNWPTIKVIHNDAKPFLKKLQRNCVFTQTSQCKYTVFSVFSGDQKCGINENNRGKSVLALDFISAQVGQFTISHHTHRHRRGPSAGEHMRTFIVNHQTQS